MGLESASYVPELEPTNPTPTDLRSQGDDHLRMIKTCAKNSLPKDLRSVASPQVGQSLRYNGTAFQNYDQYISHLTLDPASLALSVNTTPTEGSAISFDDGSLGDVFTLCAGNTSSIVIPSGNPALFVTYNMLSTFNQTDGVAILGLILKNNTTGEYLGRDIDFWMNIQAFNKSGILCVNTKWNTSGQSAGQVLQVLPFYRKVSGTDFTWTITDLEVFFHLE